MDAVHQTPDPTDEHLAAAARDGDAPAFEELVRRYDVRVAGLCRAILRDSHEATDAMQEAFLRAYRALETYDPERRFAPWLLRIAANVARDIAKKRKPRLFADAPEDAGPPEDDPAAILARREDVQLLRDAIDRLPERQRMVVTLVAVHGMNANETAESLGITAANVGVLLYRAKDSLRSSMRKKITENTDIHGGIGS